MAPEQYSDSWVREKKKLLDQLFQSPNMQVSDFPVDPHTPYFKTNNFIQQGLNRMTGYYPTDKKWYPVHADGEGHLLVSSGSTGGLEINHRDHYQENHTVLEDDAVANLTVASHDGIDVSGYNNMSVMVSSNKTVTVYIQGSNDNLNWYDIKTAADGDLSYACNNEKICFPVTHALRYFRALIYNASGSAATCTLVITGQA